MINNKIALMIVVLVIMLKMLDVKLVVMVNKPHLLNN